MTDIDQGLREAQALEQQVEQVFVDPAAVAPVVADHRRRPMVRLCERPSFANHRCWTLWGPNETGIQLSSLGMARRIVWRRDLDGNRTDPMERLRRLGEIVTPTLEVTDARFELKQVAGLIDSIPVPAVPATLVQTPRAMSLDGERYTLEIDSGSTRWLFSWFGVNMDWTPTTREHQQIAQWSRKLRDFVDGLIASEDPLKRQDHRPWPT